MASRAADVIREQMIDEAVRRVCVRPGMKRPFQFLRVRSNKAHTAECFKAGTLSDKLPQWTDGFLDHERHYVAPGTRQLYNTAGWAEKSAAEIALDISTPWSSNRYIDRIRAEFRRLSESPRV